MPKGSENLASALLNHFSVNAASVEPGADAAWAEVRQVLDDEIGRLPTRYRLPFVLCYLEGKTNDEAARLLGCPPGTVYSRLAWARDRLRHRLGGRGLALSAGGFVTLLSHDACSAAVPSPLAAATVKAALAFANEQVATAAVSSEVVALTQRVLTTMQWTQVKFVTGSLAVALSLVFAGVFALHAGEGQMSREALYRAAEAESLPVIHVVPERAAPEAVVAAVAGIGRIAGPPWAADQRRAAAAAWAALS